MSALDEPCTVCAQQLVPVRPGVWQIKYSGMTVTADDLRETHERQARYALTPEENRALPPVRPAQRSKDG